MQRIIGKKWKWMRHAAWGYVMAGLFTALTFLVWGRFDSPFRDRPMLIIFVIPVLLSAYFGGLGPGLLATALSCFGTSYFILPPVHSLFINEGIDLFQWITLWVVGILVSFLNAIMQRWILRAQAAERRSAELMLQKKAEEAIRESEEALRIIFNSTCDATILHEVGGPLVDTNETFQRLYGVSREQALKLSISDISSPSAPLHRLPELWGKAMAGELQLFEWKARRVDDGTEFDTEVFLRRIRMHGRDMLLANVRDITERKRAEEAIRESEQRFRVIFDNAGVGIVEVDTNDRFVAVNDRLCQIFGYARDDLLGMNVHDLTAPVDRATSDQINAEIHTGVCDRVSYEKRYMRRDCSLVWAHVTVSAVRDADNRWIRSITTIEDISQRKAAEEELKAAKVSAERAKAAAEEAGRAKDHFLAALSHELRTPLTPVLTTASVLGKDPQLPERYREDMEMIQRNVELEARLIDDLLDVTRITRGKIELDRKPVMLCEVIRRAVEVCRGDIEARQLKFGVDIGETAPYIIDADPARLQQVFWNLLKNAIKFTPSGGCVGIRCRRDNEGHVIAEVNDSGAGIDPTLLPFIFNPFEQGGANTTRLFGGLGLGLTITKNLVEMHNGSIEAVSLGKGKGATFRIKLPIHNGAMLKATADNNASPSQAHLLRILLVEDHGDTAKIMRRLLKAAGHEVQTAGDVATAMELAGSSPGQFDLLISDLGLPDGSGIDLMLALRAKGLNLPGIALSGYGQEEDIRRSKEAGFATHLVKPASPERLTDTIAAVTRQSSIQKQSHCETIKEAAKE